VWACGGNGASSDHPASCTLASALTGELATEYRFPWDTITSAIVATDNNRVMVSGRTVVGGVVSSSIASCTFIVEDALSLSCTVKEFYSVNLVAASFNPRGRKIVYVGVNANLAAVSLFDTEASNITSHVYTTSTMSVVDLTLVESPASFVGAFVAGTSVGSSVTAANHIFAGWLRTDTGQMAAAIGITPVSGSIVSTAGLVNAMALEATGPDSFIAGGLELSDSAGVHAYLVRANTLYKVAQFGVRYKTADANFRRALSTTAPASNLARGLALTPTALFMIVDHTDVLSNRTSLCVLKLAPATGAILSQAQVFSTSADMLCTDITVAGVLLSIACTVQRGVAPPQSLLIGVNLDLSFIQLPAGFTKNTNSTFVEEDLPLKAAPLTMVSSRASVTVTDSEVTTTNQAPTRRPSAVPTARPSQELSVNPTSRPSSSPTSAPSVSPQPSSSPSTSGPTNTHKPTFAATVRPTRSPTMQPSALPSVHPTQLPTRRPTRQPSTARPSAMPSAVPTVVPTAGPSVETTYAPTAGPSADASLSPTSDEQPVQSDSRSDQASPFVIGAFTAGAVCLGLCGLYVLYRRNQAKTKQKTTSTKIVVVDLSTPDITPPLPIIHVDKVDVKVRKAQKYNNSSIDYPLTIRNMAVLQSSSVSNTDPSESSIFNISSLHTSECSFSEYRVIKSNILSTRAVAPDVRNINKKSGDNSDSSGSMYERSDSSCSSSSSSSSNSSSDSSSDSGSSSGSDSGGMRDCSDESSSSGGDSD